LVAAAPTGILKASLAITREPAMTGVNLDLLARLPLPLAQLYRRAANAKSAQERHLSAFYLWEASLKLLGCTAVAVYASGPRHDPSLVQRLHNLARPSGGTPVLPAEKIPCFSCWSLTSGEWAPMIDACC
jgi:hypothetical protein